MQCSSHSGTAPGESADLLVGQLVAHPERIPEVWLPSKAVGGTAGEIFRILLAVEPTPAAVDTALAARGLLGIAADCAAFWQEHPHQLGELQRRLRDAMRRRMLHTLGRVCELLASDGSPPLDSPLATFPCVGAAQLQEVIAATRWLLEHLERQRASARPAMRRPAA